jgi:hypothetical protein
VFGQGENLDVRAGIGCEICRNALASQAPNRVHQFDAFGAPI